MKTEKKLAAGILAICTKTGRILLGRRNFKTPHYPGSWCIFGGTFEDKDRVPKETAKREFQEETKFSGEYKLSNEPLDIRGDNFVTFYTFIGLFDEEFVPVVGYGDDYSKEHIDYGWFNLNELPDELVTGLKDTIREKGNKIEKIIEKEKASNI